MPRVLALVLLAAAASACGGSESAEAPAPKPKPLATRTSAPIAVLRGSPARQLLVVAHDGSNERTVVQMPPGVEVNGFSWSDDGRRIAFSSYARAGYDEIYVVNGDGSGLRKVTRRRDVFAGPAWSPGGGTLAFDNHDDGNHQIWVIAADGSDGRPLTAVAGFSEPSWSPDGTKIVYADLRHGWIYVMKADGSAKRRIARMSAEGKVGGPQWSPKGDRIAFFLGQDLWIVDADGTGRKRVGGIDGRPDPAFRWSPDSKSIVFSGQIGGLDSELAIADVEAAEIRRLTDNDMQDMFPSWSPDGKALAFLRYKPGFDDAEPGPGDVYVMNADGGGERNVTDSRLDEALPLWSPRG